MFEFQYKFGQHSVYTIDIIRHKFLEYFHDLYSTHELENLHLKSVDEYTRENISDVETDLHKIFYNDIKSKDTFKKLYCELIKDIYENLFPEEDVYIYQSYPSIRIQFINNIAVPPHCDSDDIGRHPIGEKNFILPITEMFGSKRLFIESEPNKKDFKGLDLKYGDLLYFNGNTCTHYNEKNIEDTIRISLDFRIILSKDYMNYVNTCNIASTNPRDPSKQRVPTKILIGGYYQLCFDKNDILNWHFQPNKLIQNRPYFGVEEATACYEYLSTPDVFITEYTKTIELENIISKYIGVKHCIMTTSGTSALLLALLTLGIQSGDEVIVPNYTMIATVNAVKLIGAIPIIIDVERETATLSLNTVKNHITERTKAVIHVSLNNREYDLDSLSEFCNRNNIFLIEDSAQSLGCYSRGKHFGTYGHIGCFSLSTPKIISTGQGGFIITNDDTYSAKARMIKNFGRVNGGEDKFEIFGLNIKFTDIQAVIGIEQMKKIESRKVKIRDISNKYYNNLSGIHQLKFLHNATDWFPWFVDIYTDDREKLMNFLNLHNIQTRSVYPEISSTSMYQSGKKFINSEYISTTGLFLPTHYGITDAEISFVCNLIRLYYKI